MLNLAFYITTTSTIFLIILEYIIIQYYPNYLGYYLLLSSIFITFIYFQIHRTFHLNLLKNKSLQLISFMVLVIFIVSKFSILYSILEQYEPNSFFFAHPTNSKQFDLFYYSVITISTVGYGDITPISKTAKLLTTF